MLSTIGVFAVVLAVSATEGLWTWLLVSSIAEVAGQSPPPLAVMCLWLLLAWLTARIAGMSPLPLERRRQIVVASGLVSALIGGTIQSGLLHPGQLVLGSYEPDYRGAGIALLLALMYLWGRGLSLSVRVSRTRVLHHIAVASVGLAAILVFLPLTTTVRAAGLPVVVASFLIACAALLIAQLADAESRKLTWVQWAGVGAGTALIVLFASAIATGTLGTRFLYGVANVLSSAAALLTPIADAVFFGAGVVAQTLVITLRWFMTWAHVDPAVIDQAAKQAENARIKFEGGAVDGPPELMTAFVAISLMVIVLAVALTIFYRVVYRRLPTSAQEVAETRESARGRNGRGSLANLWSRMRGSSPDSGTDRRAEIRRCYRAFQTMLADVGHGRGTSQTPTEYMKQLAGSFPAADPAVQELTEAYVLARYAPVELDVPDPSRVLEAVQRVRVELRRTP